MGRRLFAICCVVIVGLMAGFGPERDTPKDPIKELERKLREERREVKRAYKQVKAVREERDAAAARAQEIESELDRCAAMCADYTSLRAALEKRILHAGMTLSEVRDILGLKGGLREKGPDGETHRWVWSNRVKVVDGKEHPPSWHYEEVTTRVVVCRFDNDGRLIDWEDSK